MSNLANVNAVVPGGFDPRVDTTPSGETYAQTNSPKPGQNWLNDAIGSVINSVGGFFSNFGSKLNPENWFNHSVFGNDVLKDQQNAAKGKIAYTKSGIPYDETNIDSQINALAQEYAYKRDDTAYSRLIQQLRDNGINPALILGNAAPMSSDTAYRSNYNMTTKDQINSATKIMAIMAMLLKFLK